jgi:hypothetical protein
MRVVSSFLGTGHIACVFFMLLPTTDGQPPEQNCTYAKMAAGATRATLLRMSIEVRPLNHGHRTAEKHSTSDTKSENC